MENRLTQEEYLRELTELREIFLKKESEYNKAKDAGLLANKLNEYGHKTPNLAAVAATKERELTEAKREYDNFYSYGLQNSLFPGDVDSHWLERFTGYLDQLLKELNKDESSQ